DILGRGRVLAGTTTQASTLIKTGEILHAADGPTVIGELDGGLSKRSMEISSLFNSCGVETRLTSDIYGAVWMKVLVNAGINPLSALMGLTNGELVEIPEVREVMVQAVREGEAVARRLRIDLGGLDPVEKMLQTARKTYRNRSSMLQDVLRGRRTEVDAINGALADIGRRLGIYTPVNEWLTRAVKDIPMIGSSDRRFHREILVRPLQHNR
ncbi:MAG: ketopantoate reductase family protein, partial [Nitrososphaerales archaeon]